MNVPQWLINYYYFHEIESYEHYLHDFEYTTMRYSDMQNQLQYLSIQSVVNTSFKVFQLIIIVLFISYFVSLSIDFIKKI